MIDERDKKDDKEDKEKEKFKIKCSECDEDVNTAEEGYFGHVNFDDLVLHAKCYKKIVDAGDWKADDVKVKNKWLKEEKKK